MKKLFPREDIENVYEDFFEILRNYLTVMRNSLITVYCITSVNVLSFFQDALDITPANSVERKCDTRFFNAA
ncbi:hypothetical protein CSB45_10095 [candidate division KSB3 bacterium]|uniref:Uncharacterized protein n=1 Tax=candidate division KSB3 bacterium TaxID=2044937 RepID=A0A2G6E4G3_9BACT|nr:MAG: hypothetical protein CSB45_10095 [candidate division KSB3 bacterium]PIE29334.1 MAG: hypothetical protein CSA57_09000 [candidate division KSB3 bacterium]